MNAYKAICLLALFSIALYLSCSAPKMLELTLPEEGEFFDLVSDYGIFDKAGNTLIPNEKLVKYEVINSLFTDYAIKDRFVYVPDGSSAKLKSDGFFDWPVGAMMVKNFSYDKAQIGEHRIIETRLLIKDAKEWKAISYVWDDAQKDARISKVGATRSLALSHKGESTDFEYVVPNKNQCKSCHNHNEKIDPLGFKYANINKEVSLNQGSVSQIAFLESKGIIKLNDSKDSIETMVAYENAELEIEDRALAYLDINCGHCHRPEGPGNTSGLFLQYNETRSNHLGFCKAPVAAGKGSGGRQFDILPGKADSSILLFRMASLDPGVMMPEVGRGLKHTEGLAIVEEWINALDFDCYAQSN